MTISFKTGAFSSRTTTGTDVITGVGFQPKIILLFSSADFSSDDTFAADYNFRFGCAVDTTAANQASMASYSQDATGGVSNCDRLWYSTGAFVREVGAGPTAQAAVSAIGSDGFTVNWTLVDGTAHRIGYICIGGTDITNTKTGTLTSPTATGNQSYTGPGFKPDFLLLWGNETTTSGATDATMGLGFATSSTNQVAQSGASHTGVSTRSAKRYQRSDNVICFIELDGANPAAGGFGGSLVSMDTNGFTINWTTVATAAQSKSFGYLAVKGGSWKVGSGTSKTSTGTQAYTGVGFQPVGLILSSACNTNSVAINANNRISFGGGSSSTDNRCVFAGDTDAGTNSVTAMIQKSAKCISVITEAATHTSSTVNAEASVSSLDASGFTLNWSTASATAYEFLYVAIGPSAAAGRNVTVSPAPESITIASPTPARTATKVRSPPAETITVGGTVDVTVFKGGHRVVNKSLPTEVITIIDNLSYTRTGRKNLTRALSETIHISDSVTIAGKTKHTGDPGYWLPLKPRIKIYQFSDTTYSTPLYTYDSFTDSGTTDKPIGLHFEDSSTTAGTFSFQIDNSADTYDLDQFARGNRVTIECSKDGLVWSQAFHGLVRSVKQTVFGPNNRIISIEGFSYLIRLNERILSTKKVSAIVGASYDRNDSTMFSNNLINDLLTNDTDYVKTIDDTQLYNVLKNSNVAGSPINDWIPRLDVQLQTVNEAINSILEYSQSMLTVDYANDQLVLFNPDRAPSGGANAFLITDNLVLNGDSSQNTMYPIQDYTYEISYDFADSANRLITSIGSAQCPTTTIPGAAGPVGDALFTNNVTSTGSVGSIIYNNWTVGSGMGSGPGASQPNSAVGMGLASGAAEIGQVLAQISMAFKAATASTGTIKVGIFKASDQSFVQFSTLDASTIPVDGNWHGYDFINTGNTYVCALNDHIAADCSGTSSTNGIGVGDTSGTIAAHPMHYLNPTPSWALESGFALSARTYQNTLVVNFIQLNGTTVQRVAILINAGNPMIGHNLGRIRLGLRSNAAPNAGSLYWVGIRKGSDNSFVYFGGGLFDANSFHPLDNVFYNYDYDKLDNHYQLAVGDRISIETNMTSGHIDVQCSVDSPSTQTTQIWNGSTYTTSGIVGYNVGCTLYQSLAQPDIIIDPCGGPPETRDADPLLTIASDCNMTKRIGMVEAAVTNVPPHVKTFQAMNEFLFNKLYIMSRPRFSFDYPSLTLPGIMPKAGDIVSHIAKKAGVGVRRGVVQTGVIIQVAYDFAQNEDSILGLRKLSVQTNGILRGSY